MNRTLPDAAMSVARRRMSQTRRMAAIRWSAVVILLVAAGWTVTHPPQTSGERQITMRLD